MARPSLASRLSDRPHREQRTLAIGVLLLLLLVLVLFIVSPLVAQLTEMNSQREMLSFNAKKYAQIAANSQTLINSKKESLTHLSEGDFIYANIETSLSVVKFEEDLRQKIESVGLRIDKLLPSLPQTSTDLILLPATVEVTGHPSKFVDLIYLFENTTPLIRIDRLEINANPSLGTQGTLKARLHSFNVGVLKND